MWPHGTQEITFPARRISSAAGRPLRPARKQAIGAAVRSEAWAAIAARSNSSATCESLGVSRPSSAANPVIQSFGSILFLPCGRVIR